MAGFATLLFEKQGAVAHLSLNRPTALNAYNLQLRDDFSEALAAVAADEEVRALLITGEGRAFCAGADLTEFGTAPSQVIARQVRWQRDVWGQLAGLKQPIVTAVHGYCIGSGLELVLLSDLRLAAAGTVFAMPEVHLGMIPAAGGSQTLPRNGGTAAALDLLLTGRRMDAVEALAMRLITRVMPAGELRAAAWELAAGLARVEGDTLAQIKALVRGSGELSLAAGLAREDRLARRCKVSGFPFSRE